MHQSKLFTILILAVMAQVASAFSSQILMTHRNGNEGAEMASPEPSGEVVIDIPVGDGAGYKKFLAEISTLDEQLLKISQLRERVTYLHRRLDEIDRVRSSWGYGRVEDEISMDLMVSVLHEIPKAENFKVENCDSYRTNIFINYDPTSSSLHDPREPSVKKAYQIVKKICN